MRFFIAATAVALALALGAEPAMQAYAARATEEKTMSAIMEAGRTAKKKGSQEWLSVTVPKETLKATTEPEFREFCSAVVKDSGYSWVTIVCGDGTGIQFPGSFAGAAEYGMVDGYGQIDEPLGYISLKNGKYIYVDKENAE